MNSKYVHIDFDRCTPDLCGPVAGTCPAAAACTRGLLEQDEPFAGPMLISGSMCVACGDCVRACPQSAIRIEVR